MNLLLGGLKSSALVGVAVLVGLSSTSLVWSADDAVAAKSRSVTTAQSSVLKMDDGGAGKVCEVRKLVQRGAPGKSQPVWKTRTVPCAKP
jgi:hypothetical protein